MWTVYVIQSDEKLIYTGMTQNLSVRISQHNDKRLKSWTNRGTNWKPVYTKNFPTRIEAQKYEKWLKTGAGREFIKEIVKNL